MSGGRAWAGWGAQLAAMGSLMAPPSATPLSAQEIPPDSVTTVFVSDTIPGFGAVGGVAVDALGFVSVADFRNAVWRLSPGSGCPASGPTWPPPPTVICAPCLPTTVRQMRPVSARTVSSRWHRSMHGVEAVEAA
jgi:hypothetical protein